MDYIYTSYKIVDSIVRNGAFSSIELNNALKLTPNDDKSKVTRIVYGVLDNSIKYDYIIKNLCAKKPKGSIVSLLKVALYLLYEMSSVPDYATINNCVKIAKKVSKGALGGFVNSTLRAAVDYQLVLPTDKMEGMSIEFSTPKLIVEMLVKEYGEDLTRCMLTKVESNSANVRINLRKTTMDEFKSMLTDAEIEFKDGILPNCLIINLAKLINSKLDNTLFTVQALASVLACELLDVKIDSEILDTCAAPGGKSVYMAEIARNGQVTACDIIAHRLVLIRKYAERMGATNVASLELDGVKFDESLVEKFDRVLCDAPCSGVGAQGSKPDIVFSFSQKKLDELSELQFQILNNSAKYLKKGGEMIYSTCTMFDKENSEVVERFLKNNSDFEEMKIDNLKVEFFKKQHGIQLLPNISDTIGFYVAKLRKI
ncbi:MAG: 16S rRNA (cytosine(967)-C(5))-methyltransferase RsmB [Clostridia bacterium]